MAGLPSNLSPNYEMKPVWGKLCPPCNLQTLSSESMTNPCLKIIAKLKEKQIGRFQFVGLLRDSHCAAHTFEHVTFVVNHSTSYEMYVLNAYEVKSEIKL